MPDKNILLFEYEEIPVSLLMETARKTAIENYQSFQIGVFEMQDSQRVEAQFNSKYHGESNPLYNCHGLTFASRRTGIFQDSEIVKILKDEYKEIKILKEVLVGDVVIYYDKDNGISHSAVVIWVDKEGLVPKINVLSKARKYKEIIHDYRYSPYEGEKKFYRVKHEYTILE